MFDKLASFTPQASTTPTTTSHKDLPFGFGNLFSGGEIKHNRELEKLNLQHLNNMELNKWNAQWNKAMDDTKVQRSIKDLEAAGINPILAHGQTLGNTSSGASAGSGSAGSGSGSSSKLGKMIKTLATLILKSF